MNAHEATDRALRVRVERIVRPVKASATRKDRMREELLQHLREAHAVEQDVEVAAARLGDPWRLTRELQDTVPAWERLLLAGSPQPTRLKRWLMRRTGEPMWRYALRSALVPLVATALSLGVSLGGCLLILSMNDKPLPAGAADRLAHLMLIFAVLCVGVFVSGFLSPYLAQWVHRAVWERTLPIAAAAGACAIAMVGASALVLWIGWAAIGLLPYTGPALWAVPAVALLAPVVLVGSAGQQALQQRRYERWTSLDLAD